MKNITLSADSKLIEAAHERARAEQLIRSALEIRSACISHQVV
jgi:hypothetical protein